MLDDSLYLQTSKMYHSHTLSIIVILLHCLVLEHQFDSNSPFLCICAFSHFWDENCKKGKMRRNFFGGLTTKCWPRVLSLDQLLGASSKTFFLPHFPFLQFLCKQLEISKFWSMFGMHNTQMLPTEVHMNYFKCERSMS